MSEEDERIRDRDERKERGEAERSEEKEARLVNHWTSIRVVTAFARCPSLIIDTINDHSLETPLVHVYR